MANFTGTSGSDTFGGTRQADVANMRSGNDTARGLTGDDILRGEGGNDFLSGGAGDDTVSGGGGSDRLFGGDGDDTFRFPDSDGRPSTDRVGDFTRGDDVLFIDIEFGQLDSDGNGRLTNADEAVSTQNGALVLNYAAGEALALSGVRQLTEADFLS